VQIGLALYFATVLSFKVKLKNLFKGILFFPYLINGVAIGMIFLYFFQPGGTLDATLGLFGLQGLSQQWLGDPDVINVSLAGTSVWRYLGLNFVLFLGAVQSIPGELYEAAEIDGADRWQQFRHIILPGIRPVVGLSFILAISGSLSVFEIPFIMTGGANGSETFVIQTVEMAFKFHKFGLASAMAVVLLLIVLLITWIQRRIVPEEKVQVSIR
jgi:raffinose/stachyose/melibiose transport system permease protein